MQEHSTEQELRERLRFIESMIAEGRRNTESWGWTFALWGVVLYVAMAWSTWGHGVWAWPATVSVGFIVTILIASLKAGNHPGTTLGRATGSIWIALGISMFLLFLTLGLSGRLTDQHLFLAVMSAMLGMANGASGLVLRWKLQIAAAIVWWAAAVATCFGTDAQSTMVFLAAIFLCQIVFGVYGVIADAQRKRRQTQVGPANA
jgi:hypothetical protein